MSLLSPAPVADPRCRWLPDAIPTPPLLTCCDSSSSSSPPCVSPPSRLQLKQGRRQPEEQPHRLGLRIWGSAIATEKGFPHALIFAEVLFDSTGRGMDRWRSRPIGLAVAPLQFAAAGKVPRWRLANEQSNGARRNKTRSHQRPRTGSLRTRRVAGFSLAIQPPTCPHGSWICSFPEEGAVAIAAALTAAYGK